MDPSLVFLIIDEDFLLNKKRAMQFRDCVMKGGKTLSIFAFSSVKAISQYTVEEILEMGIDGFWIGYEGTRSNYAKQQGRPIEEILTEFREHGITILTSMIVGFDYQTPEVVAQEFDGLMKLKPALGQYLIYGPPPGTPFYERVMREHLMHEKYVQDPDADVPAGRRLHHHDEASDAVARRRSRVSSAGVSNRISNGSAPASSASSKARFLGYQKLKNSPNPFLRQKAEVYAADLRCAYPVFLAGRLLGPNAAVRRWIGDLEQRIHAELGRPALGRAIPVRHGRRGRAVDGR